MAAALGLVLLLGIASFFSLAHRHDTESLGQDLDCAACAWHNHAKFDSPAPTPVLSTPETVCTGTPEPLAVSIPRRLSGHSSRGPPQAS